MSAAFTLYRLGKVITRFIFFLFSTLLLILCLLLFTHPGNLIIINEIERLEPSVSLQLEHGSLFNKPHFSKVSWQDQQNTILVENISIDVDWSCVLEKLCISHLNLSHADIQINSQHASDLDDDRISSSIDDFNFPFAVAIDSLELSNINVKVDDFSAHITSLNLQLSAQNNDVNLQGVLDGLLLTFPESVNDDKTQKQVDKKLTIPYPALISPDMLTELKLPVSLSIDGFTAEDVSINEGGNSVFHLNSLAANLTYRDTRLTINNLDVDIPETNFALLGNVDFSKHYPMSIEVQGSIKEIEQIQPVSMFSGQDYTVQLDGDLSQLKSVINLSNKLQVQLHSEFNLMAENFPYKTAITWQNMRWPLDANAQYTSQKGELSSSGDLSNYELYLSALYNIENIPSGEIDFTAKGSLTDLNFNRLQLKTLKGLIDLNGTLDWSQGVNWDGELLVDKVNIADINSDYTGLISGTISQNVQFIEDRNGTENWSFSAYSIDLYGDFLERPFVMQGSVTGDKHSGIAFNEVVVKNANNVVSINGIYAQQNDIEIVANIEDFSHFLLDSSGSLKGNINVKGDKTTPNIEMNIQANDIHYSDMSFNKVSVIGKTRLAENTKVDLQIEVNESLVSGENIDKIVLDIKNMSDNANSEIHQINLSLQSEIVTTDLQLQITQTGNEWLSILNNAEIFSYHQQLKLANPLTIQLNEEHLIFNAHCWDATNANRVASGKLCFEELNVGAEGKAKFDIESYLLSNLDPYLPEELRISGALNADAQVEWFTDKKPIFDINVSSSNMSVKVNINGDNEKAIQYPIETFDFKLSSDKEKSNVDATIYADNLIDAHINGSLFPYQNEPEIQANLKLLMNNLSPFSVIFPDLETLDGSINADVSVDGLLLSPNSHGSINFTGINIATTSLPVAIYQLNSEITLSNKTAQVDGEFYSNQLQDDLKENVKNGKVNIKGKVDWQSSLQGDVNLYANQMHIDDFENISLVVSPNIHIFYADNLSIIGDINIDEGSIVINELSDDAIEPSNDIIVVDIVVDKETQPLPIQIDLNLGLGKKLRLDAFGLKTMVTGDLRIQKALQKKVTLHGVVKLVDGSYRSLGQQLVIQNSNLTFQGSPERPYLTLEAIRDPQRIEKNVTAGVRVTGLPGELSLVIFSDPVMSQQDAISYITRGKSMQNNSDSSSDNQMTTMLINLGAGTSANALSDFGDNFGVEDLSLTTSGTGDEQSVDISGYIAPDVQLSYGVGVFDSFSVVAIRYEMFERFFIEASSGLYQALDAYYEFDWD